MLHLVTFGPARVQGVLYFVNSNSAFLHPWYTLNIYFILSSRQDRIKFLMIFNFKFILKLFNESNLQS